jgi:hypothetical protein
LRCLGARGAALGGPLPEPSFVQVLVQPADHAGSDYRPDRADRWAGARCEQVRRAARGQIESCTAAPSQQQPPSPNQDHADGNVAHTAPDVPLTSAFSQPSPKAIALSRLSASHEAFNDRVSHRATSVLHS